MISSKDLVYQALSFESVPRIPYGIGFTILAEEKFCSDPDRRELFEKIDNDLIASPVLRVEFGVRGKDGKYTDEFGVVWDRHIDADIGLPQPIVTPENFSEYRFPDPCAEGRFDALIDNVNHYPDKFNLMNLDLFLYERAWSLRGMENLLIDLVANQDFVEALLDKILEFNIAVIRAGLRTCPEIDGVRFGDDFGTQSGMVMGADRWRKVFKPRLARQYQVVKSAGKKVFIHSCGRVQEIFDDLVEIGVDCFNPFQPEVMDVQQIHGRYRGKLAFWGGVSTQHLLPYGTVNEVRQQVDKLLKMGSNGGYIIAPAHDIPPDAKPENIQAMLQAILNQ